MTALAGIAGTGLRTAVSCVMSPSRRDIWEAVLASDFNVRATQGVLRERERQP
jgi:hypothetical protein